MSGSAFWRRLDTPGHDAARLRRQGDGWMLSGTAVFLQAGAPACLGYEVLLHADWRTHRAEVRGFVGAQTIAHTIERDVEGWVHNGDRIGGFEEIVDIDFGFTPATNFAQMRRIDLAIGDEASFSVAWFDVGAPRLVVLPQYYRRLDACSYAYASPTLNYEATLRMNESAFVADYPGLWVTE